MLHVGKLIAREIERCGMAKTEFARRMCCTRGNVYRMIESADIDVEQLERASEVLGVNFFAILAEKIEKKLREEGRGEEGVY